MTKSSEARKAIMKRWYEKNKEAICARNRARFAANKDAVHAAQRSYRKHRGGSSTKRALYQKNRDVIRANDVKRRAAIKRCVIDKYGGVCKCGEKRLEFLTLDHVDNDGGGKKRVHQGARLYLKIFNGDIEPNLQVLCFNCNMKKEKDLVRGTSKASVQRHKLKLDALNVYGTACECCGEHDVDVLCFDHKNGDGATHRREIGKKHAFIPRWARQNGWPKIFRVLCANCNFSTHMGRGVCLHHRDLPD